ncbi:MAG: hypothetical protein GY816_03435 [Cytophagales bacterium]|nr:hypothetical protein [Cytophagales bacterium]
MIVNAINRAFETADERKWEKTYWALDIHDTILKPNWKSHQIPTDFYPCSKEALRLLSQREDVVLFLYTCSHPRDTDQYIELFKSYNIHIDYVNENPEIVNDDLGYYDKKPYFNVIIDDKAGFDPIIEWPMILQWLQDFQN